MTSEVTQEFNVSGMHCNGCVGSVTRAISQVPGVRKVDVSLERKRATVRYDGEATRAQAIITAIEDAGFEASAC
jgi:copper chaperone